MTTHQTKNNSCTHAEDILVFIYDEMAEAEKAKFQSHLRNCSQCATDLNEFAFVRSSISQWLESDFAPIAAPAFILPAQGGEISLSEKSFFVRIFAFLNLNSVHFAASAAAILIIAGFGWILFRNSTQQEFALNRAPDKSLNIEPANANSTLNDNLVTDRDIVSEKSEMSQTPSAPQVVEKPVESAQSFPIRAVVTDKSYERPKTQALKSSLERKRALTNRAAPKSVKNSKLPSLYTEDAEVESIRLSDILEEVSMK